jgi:hypothetical protein
MANNAKALLNLPGLNFTVRITALWGTPTPVKDGNGKNAKPIILTLAEVEIRKSLKYDNSYYGIVTVGDKSDTITILKGEIDEDDITLSGDKGDVVTFNDDVEVELPLCQVTAIRDDEELEIASGDQGYRLQVSY